MHEAVEILLESLFTSFCFLAKLLLDLHHLWVDLGLGRDLWSLIYDTYFSLWKCIIVETMEQHFRVWKTGGKTPISLAAEDELSQIPARWEACLWILCPSWDCWPQKPASGFESWCFPNIIALKFFFATNKIMFRTNINALKHTIVLWSPVNRSKFLKTDVFVVWCWCGRGFSYSYGWDVSPSPKKGMKWWFFTHETQKSTTVILPSNNY